jgi:hypothetical protein
MQLAGMMGHSLSTQERYYAGKESTDTQASAFKDRAVSESKRRRVYGQPARKKRRRRVMEANFKHSKHSQRTADILHLISPQAIVGGHNFSLFEHAKCWK